MNAERSTVLVTCTDAEGAGAWNRVEELVAVIPTLREFSSFAGRRTALKRMILPTSLRSILPGPSNLPARTILIGSVARGFGASPRGFDGDKN